MEILSFSRYFREEQFPISVTAMPGNELVQKKPLTFHTHEFSELVLVAKGTIVHQCGTETVRLKAGDFLLIHPGDSHGYAQPSRDFLLYNLLYNADIPVPMLLVSNLPFVRKVYPAQFSIPTIRHKEIFHISGRNLERVILSLEELREEVKAREIGNHILIISLFMEIIVRLARSHKDSSEKPSDWALERVVSYLQCHCGGKIKLGQLARNMGMSERTLTRRFKSAFGTGPIDYLTTLRVRHAVELLQDPNLKLEAVALECGFCDGSHLWKVLQRKLKKSPAEVRRDYNLMKRNPAAPSETEGTAKTDPKGKTVSGVQKHRPPEAEGSTRPGRRKAGGSP